MCHLPPHLQVLSDDEKRGIYDRFGEQGLKGGFAGAGAGGMGGMGDFRWGRRMSPQGCIGRLSAVAMLRDLLYMPGLLLNLCLLRPAATLLTSLRPSLAAAWAAAWAALGENTRTLALHCNCCYLIRQPASCCSRASCLTLHPSLLQPPSLPAAWAPAVPAHETARSRAMTSATTCG